MTARGRNAGAVAGTVLLHLLLVVLLLLWEVPVTASGPAEVDLDWVLPAPATGSPGVDDAADAATRTQATVTDRHPAEHGRERKVKSATSTGKAPERPATRGGVAVAIGWKSGPERKKRSGTLPAYPAGIKAGGEVRVDVTVAPDGTVSKVVPAQRGDKRLRQAAVKAVRSWRFEPLRGAAPRRSQGCTITFRFRPR